MINLPFDIQIKDVVLFALAGALSVALYWMSRRRKNLAFTLERRRIVWRSGDHPAGLHITFNGADIRDFNRLTLYLINSGSEPILRADLQTRAHIDVKIDPARITRLLQAGVGKQTRESNNVRYDSETHQIDFDYLNSGDAVSFDFFCELSENERFSNIRLETERDPPIRIEGEIIGSSVQPAYQRFSQLSKPIESFFNLFLPATLVGALAVVSIGIWSKAATTIAFYVSIGAAALFTITSLGLVGLGLRRLLVNARRPQSIRS